MKKILIFQIKHLIEINGYGGKTEAKNLIRDCQIFYEKNK